MGILGLRSVFRWRTALIVVSTLSTIWAASWVLADPPGRTSSFYGTVTVGGQDIAAGTSISAEISSVSLAVSEIFVSPEGSAYRLDLPADDPMSPGSGGGLDGDVVTFRINGSPVAATGSFQASLYQRLDLAADTGTDLSVSLDDGVSEAAPGELLSYLLTVSNLGDDDAFGVVLSDLLPAEVSFVEASDGGSVAASTVTWPVFDLPAGASAQRSLTLQVNTTFPAGTLEIRNSATVRDDGQGGIDPLGSNNTAVDVDALAGGPDLKVSQQTDVAAVEPGGDVVYTITIENNGFQNAEDVEISGTLPPEVIFLTASDDGRALDGVVTWPTFTLPLGEVASRTLRVRLQPDVGPDVVDITQTVSVTAPVPDVDQADNVSVSTLPVVRETDLRVLLVDPSTATLDAQELQLSGFVDVTVENSGNANLSAPFTTLVFEDLDGDDLYTPGVDNTLGAEVLTTGLNVGQATTIQVPVAGSVRFRDHPLHAFVDSDDVIPELDEFNNIEGSGGGCEVIPVPGDFNPVVEVNWPLPNTDVRFSADSLSTPLVVQLTDDNGDGRRDALDTPDLVFVSIDLTFLPNPQPRLRAISGDSGERIFDAFPPVSQFLFFALTGMAAGDIDLDGAPEIIVSVFDFRGPTGQPNRLAAYDHRGQLQWISAPYATHPDGDSLTNRDNPTLADLDRDGVPEIIVGANVFNADGSLRWSGSGGQGYQSARNDDGFDSGAISIVADLDLSGDPEVVTGNTAYRSDGSVYWQLPLDDGYTAVANFDGDDFPEIVVVARGTVRLHQHDGSLIWTTEHPGSGPEAGGAPTVADFDGDGEPEIGVAGSTQYAVFEGDGSVRWQTATQDGSSNMTGSTVFDLDGDGQFEVIYRDETALRIYRGNDGVVLYTLPLSSITLNEQPVVADVDGDGNAEIVVTSDVANGVNVPQRTRGLRILGDDNWVGARGAWNQHAYHIGNIADDGTIPSQETPSWLDHNTYRANVVPSEGAFAAPDLSASRLRFDFTGYPDVEVTARVGNGGSGPASAGLPVAFYDGDPATGGQLLATTAVDRRLAPGDFEDVTASFTLPGFGVGQVFVAADDDGSGVGVRSECDETNNVHGTTYSTDFLGLVLSLDDGIDAVRPGDSTTYTLTFTNAAQISRSGVELRATLPPGMDFVSASFGGVVNGNDVVWPGIDLSAEETAQRQLVVAVDVNLPLSVESLELVATVSDDGAAGPEPSPENNTASDLNQVLTVIASAGGPYAGAEGELLVFDASGSIDRDGGVLDFSWDLDNDGVFDDAVGPSASHVFGDDGEYQVAVRAAAASGDVDVAEALVSLSNQPPSFELGDDLDLVEGSAVVFESLPFSDPGFTDTHTATVDWGDGTVEPVDLLESTDGTTLLGTLDTAHAYLDDGVYSLELCLSDDDAATVCDQVAVSVVNSPPDVLDGGNLTVVIDEGDEAEAALPFKDLGPADTHTSQVDWGDGTVAPGFIEVGVGPGVVLFEDHFDTENGGSPQLNYFNLEHWVVTEGAIDLIGNGSFDFLPGNGLYLDLDGSRSNAGTLRSRTSIAVSPGRYQLRFDLAGSRRRGTDTVIVRFGDLLEETFVLPSSAPFTAINLPFTVTTPTSAVIEFEHLGGDNLGLLLDNVLLADECLLAQLDGGLPDTGGAPGDDPTATSANCGLAGGMHTYLDDGNYAAEICVTDDDGGVDCGSVPIEVRNVLPVVDAGDDRIALANVPMPLDGVFFDPGVLDPHTVTIDWGDGTQDNVDFTPEVGGGAFTAEHTYGPEGDYSVEVCVSDDDGQGCDQFIVFWRQPRNDLAIQLSTDGLEVRPSEPVVLNLEAANLGALDPGEVTVSLTLPEELEVVAASDGGVAADGQVVWILPTLGFGEVRNFTVDLIAPAALTLGDEVSAVATVQGDSGAPDVDPSNDSATVTLLLWDDETPYVAPIDGLSGVEGSAVSFFTRASSEPEKIYINDNFNSERNGRGTLNYVFFANWSVTNGSVDLIGNGYFDFLSGNGLYVDLDGSTGNAGRFASREIFELRPGTYTLAFDLAGNRRDNRYEEVVISVGDFYQEVFTAPRQQPFVRVERTFTVDTTGPGEVVFDHAGGDNLGLLLDDVLFTRTCAKSVTIDWGDGVVETFDGGANCEDINLGGEHVYLDDGVYPIEACVTDEQGDFHCTETVATITNAPPIPSVQDLTLQGRRLVTVEVGTFTDLGVVDTHTATVDWGDGTVSQATVAQGAGQGTVVDSHAYALPGFYEATLCVVDDDGGEGCADFMITATGDSAAVDLIAEKTDLLGLDADGDGTPTPGDFLTYDIVVTNLGGVEATQVRLFDPLAPYLRVVPGGLLAGDGIVLSEEPLDIDLGVLAPGASKTVHFYAEILPAAGSVGQVANQALISSQEQGDLLSDDPSTLQPADPTITVLGEVPDEDDGETTLCEPQSFVSPDWALALIGDADQGAATTADGYLQLEGDGSSLYHGTDNGAFFYRPISALRDWRLEVDVTGFPVDTGGAVRKTSLMLRGDLDPLAPRVMVTYVPHIPTDDPASPETTALQFDARLLNGSDAVEIANTAFDVPLPSRQTPVRLAIEKRADVFTVLYSLDGGASWTLPDDATFHGMAQVASGESLLAGVMVASYDTQVPLVAEHGDFTECRPDPEPPYDPPAPPTCDAGQPADVIVLLDASGSMTAPMVGTDSKLSAAQAAIEQLASSLAGTGSRMALATASGFRTPSENLNGAYRLLAPLSSDLAAVASLAGTLDAAAIDAGTPTPASLALAGVVEQLTPTFDASHQPVLVWLSDGIANIDSAGRGPEPYELDELQAIDLRRADGSFKSWGEVGWSGAFNGATGTFDGEPLANAMWQLERLDIQVPEILVYGLALEGDGIELGTFNPGLLEYAAHVSGGRAFRSADLATLLASVSAVVTDLDCGGSGTAALSGRVWNDRDGDGFEAADTSATSEPGLPGVSVGLFDAQGMGLLSTTTDDSGTYLFGGLPAATYSVQVDAATLPIGEGGQPIDQPTYDLDGIDPPSSIDTTTLTLSDGELRSDVRFGYLEAEPPPPSEICEVDSFAAAGLDAAWQWTQIGDADQGEVAVVDERLHLTSDGTSLFHGSDNGTFLHRSVVGDFRAGLKIVGVPEDTGGPVRKVCLMARADVGPNAARLMVCHIPHLPGTTTQALQFDVRHSDGNAEEIADLVINAVLPLHVALERQDGVLRVLYSLDNQMTWIQPSGRLGGEVSLDLGAEALLGVMAASYDAAVTTTFAVDDFAVCRPGEP